eukprot:1158402-Pelagomonas_calceolata.AAC.15
MSAGELYEEPVHQRDCCSHSLLMVWTTTSRPWKMTTAFWRTAAEVEEERSAADVGHGGAAANAVVVVVAAAVAAAAAAVAAVAGAAASAAAAAAAAVVAAAAAAAASVAVEDAMYGSSEVGADRLPRPTILSNILTQDASDGAPVSAYADPTFSKLSKILSFKAGTRSVCAKLSALGQAGIRSSKTQDCTPDTEE